jgi:methionyl-tRNA formyltransferase
MKFGFVTCVQLGLACIEEIYHVGGKLDLVFTLHDRLARKKSGRVYVEDFCVDHGIDLVKIRSVNDVETIEAVRSREIDWLFIIGWSQIARRGILNVPKRGCLGMHPTLLPKGRGRAAIPWAIIKGLESTGVTLFKLDAGVDTGPILAQEVLPLSPNETATQLYGRVEDAHRTLISRVWSDLAEDKLTLQEQDHSLATEWPERRPEDGAFHASMAMETVDRLVRAVTHPYPGAFMDYQGIRYRIWKGELHSIDELAGTLTVDSHNHLWIKLSDGFFKATEWETEQVESDRL